MRRRPLGPGLRKRLSRGVPGLRPPGRMLPSHGRGGSDGVRGRSRSDADNGRRRAHDPNGTDDDGRTTRIDDDDDDWTTRIDDDDDWRTRIDDDDDDWTTRIDDDDDDRTTRIDDDRETADHRGVCGGQYDYGISAAVVIVIVIASKETGKRRIVRADRDHDGSEGVQVRRRTGQETDMDICHDRGGYRHGVRRHVRSVLQLCVQSAGRCQTPAASDDERRQSSR